MKTEEQNRVYDLTEQSWGHTMERQWAYKAPLPDGREKVQGSLTPYPRVGDRVKMHVGSTWEFDEVSEQKSNPRDLYFATVRETPTPRDDE